MNAEGNFAWIDDHSRIHFITTYSTYFARDLAAIPIDHFEPVDMEKNRQLVARDREEDRLLAYRTRGEYWGKERTVVVTYNPANARKQAYTFENKLESLRQELLVMRAKVRDGAPHWRDPTIIEERYVRLCQRLHISSHAYKLTVEPSGSGLTMSFRKDVHQVRQQELMFGKNIIITDNTDWTTPEIVQASLDRWQVEDRFRISNDDNLVGVRPIRHWTDSKIRCHLFTCVVAMTYLRRMELKLAAKGIHRTAEDIMDDMRRLHSVLTFKTKDRQPIRRLETPSKTQTEVLSAFNHQIDERGVLQKILS